MRRSLFLFALFAIVLAASGCRSQKKKVIGVVPKATSHLFWVNVQQGAEAAAKQFDVEMIWNGPPSETDYSRQIQIVDSLVARRVDALAVAATDRKSLVGPVERAVKAGIPVTIFDSGLDTEQYLSFVATNNYEGGILAARKLAELVGGKGNVALLAHAPGSYSTMERERGFRDTIAKDFPQIHIVAQQFGMSDRAKARAAAENLLAAHTDLVGIFASSEPSSVGTALAVKSRELSGKVKLVTFDSSDGLVEDLRNGAIQAMVVQDPYKIGFEAVRTLVDKLNGKRPPKQLDLSARVITKEDLEQPDVKALLFPQQR